MSAIAIRSTAIRLFCDEMIAIRYTCYEMTLLLDFALLLDDLLLDEPVPII